MDEDELHARVDEIIAMDDAEVMHGTEDELRLAVIYEFCPSWVVDEIKRLAAADFPRWCA